MVDWTSGTADASVAERDSAFMPLRVPGTPDVFKEAPVSGFVTKDASGNVGIGASPSAARFYSASAAGQDSAQFSDATNYTLVFRAYGGTQGMLTGTTGTSLTLGSNNTGKWHLNNSGVFHPWADNSYSLGAASFRCSVLYAGTGSINTSDQRAKADIGAIPDDWLDAWADVQWRRYKFDDGVRWHIGLVAQEVHAAFAAHNIDAFEIGLCCFDEWEEQREPILDDNGIETGETRVALEAGDRWGLRYDECQAMEAAYQRRENVRMAARVAALEAAP